MCPYLSNVWKWRCLWIRPTSWRQNTLLMCLAMWSRFYTIYTIHHLDTIIVFCNLWNTPKSCNWAAINVVTCNQSFLLKPFFVTHPESNSLHPDIQVASSLICIEITSQNLLNLQKTHHKNFYFTTFQIYYVFQFCFSKTILLQVLGISAGCHVSPNRQTELEG